MEDPEKTFQRQRDTFEQGTDGTTIQDKRARMRDGRFVVGDVICNRYEVLSELGQGGMGVVYKCFDKDAGITIALKALPPELSHNTQEMEEVRDNFQLVSKLVHQNIAISKNLEKDKVTGNYYLIMECVEGEDLRRWIKRKRKDNALTLEAVLPVIRQVAAALDYAHEEKIIHRDIKPGNIMIDAAGHVKVLDFGLAAQIHTSMTRVSMAYHGTSGTGPYMAPEQWRGKPQGAAADQYALAVMAYEMLAGHLPFESTDAAVLQQAVLTQDADPVVGIPKHAQAALTRGMSKDPATRFDSCGDFAAALAGQKVSAARKRKNGKGAWFAAAAVLIVLLAGAGYGVHQYMEQERSASETAQLAEAQKRQEAERQKQLAEAQKQQEEEKKARDYEVGKENYRLIASLEEAIKQIKETVDPGQTFGKHIKDMEENYKSGNKAKETDILMANEFLHDSAKEQEWIKQNAPLREQARALIDQVEQARSDAQQYEAVKFAPTEFITAEDSEKKAQTTYESGDFQAAIKEFEACLFNYRNAFEKAQKESLASLIREAEQAKNENNWDTVESCAEKIRPLDSETADRLSGEAKEGKRKQQVASLLKDAKKAADNNNWKSLQTICADILNLEPDNKTGKELAGKAETQLQLIARENQLRLLKERAEELQKQEKWDDLKACANEILTMDEPAGKKLLATAEEGLKRKEQAEFLRRIEQDRKRGFIYSKDGTKLYKAPYQRTPIHYSIPNGVKTIGNKAFYVLGTSYTGITIPESVTIIEDEAFDGCDKWLHEIVLPAKLQKIGKSAFEVSDKKALTELVVRGEMLEIGERAFARQDGLKKVTIQGTVKKIGKEAFQGCKALEEIVIQGKVDLIEKEAFSACQNLTKFTVSGEVGTFEGGFTSCDKLEEIVISGKMETIGDRAFYGLDSLKKVTITGEVTIIEESAFADYMRKTILHVSLPNSVTRIARNAFDLSNTRLSFAEGSRFYQDKNGALIDREEQRLICLPDDYSGRYTVPQGIKTIGSFAFFHCEKLSQVTIPESVTEIEGRAFDLDKTRLVLAEGSGFYQDQYGALIDRRNHVFVDLPTKYSGSYSIPDGIKKIGPHAFRECQGLKEVIIPEGVTDIGEYAFCWCAGKLKDVRIPSSVTYIGKGAFRNSIIQTISLPKGLTRIEDDLFRGCEKLEKVDIPDSVTTVGKGAFTNCDSLRNIVIPNGVKQIGELAFWGCDVLKTITLPKGLTSIGHMAFYSCKSLQSITLSEGLTSIGSDAFYSCESLQSITLPEGLTSIGSEAFQSCKSLQSITLPEGLTGIGSRAFQYCDKLESIVIPDSVNRIEDNTFFSCKALREITLPENVTIIGNDAFFHCTSLQKVVVGQGLKEIGASAFSGCTSLSTISLPSGIESIGSSAFYDVPCRKEIEERYKDICN